MAVALVLSLGLRVATYDPIADGGGSRYFKVAQVSVLAAAGVWWLVRRQTGPGRRLPLVAALAVLLPGEAVHYGRLLHPITRGAPLISFSTSFAGQAEAQRQWEAETSGAGSVDYEPGAVRLTSPPGATAYIRARLPARPDPQRRWWLPLGLAEREPGEEITWRALVQRTGAYYVVADIGHLLIQATPYGLHLTYPDPQRVVRGHEIQHPLGSDGQVHVWRLTGDRQRITLSIDGQPVWSAPQQGGLGPLRLGETKADPLHGGSMRLEAASYVSRLGTR